MLLHKSPSTPPIETSLPKRIHEVARIGLQFRIADMNGDDKKYMVVLGKSGTHILFNEG